MNMEKHTMNNPSVLTEEDHKEIKRIEREHADRMRSALRKEFEVREPKSYEELMKENEHLIPGKYHLI